MRLIYLKGLVYFVFFMLSAKCHAQENYSDTKFKANFSLEQLILRDWEFIEARQISADNKDTNSVSRQEGEMKYLHFSSKNRVLYHNYPLYSDVYATRSINFFAIEAIRTYRIVQNRLTDERRLIILEHGDSAVFRNFRIEAFTFNRIVLTDLYDTNPSNKGLGKRLLTYELKGQEAQTRSLGAWLHYGRFEIYNFEDTDSLQHQFIRIKKDQDIRDTVEFGEITFKLELMTDGTYNTFCTGGVLGAVNIGKYKIDLMKQKLYFFEKDNLVYDYYFNSDHEMVLDLSPDSRAVDN